MLSKARAILLTRSFSKWRSDVPYDRNVLNKRILSGDFVSNMPVEAFKMELHDQILDVVRTSTLTSCVKVFGATIDFGSNFQVKRFDEENPSGEAESQDDKLRALIKQQIQPTWINGIPVKSEGGTTEKEDLLAIGKEEIAKLKYKIATREMHPEASERLTGTFKRCTLLDLLMLKEEAKVYSSKSRITAWFIKNQKVDN